MKTRLNSQSGFTLIELMVVMVILGMLAALALPAYASMVRRARYAEVRQQMGTMAKEATIYQLEKGHYPVDVQRNIAPAGITWPEKIPFNGTYDYDHWSVGGGQCYVQIGFVEENKPRSYLIHRINAQPSEFREYDGNLVLGIDIYNCSASAGPIR